LFESKNALSTNVPVVKLAETVDRHKPRSQWRRFTHIFVRDRAALAGACIMVMILALVVLSPVISPYDPLYQSTDPADHLAAPSERHIMGTDDLRRDIFSRVLSGGATTIQAGVFSIAGAVTVGMILGLIAGYFGNSTDQVISRIIDVLMTLPGVLLAIVVIAILGPGLGNAMIAVAIANIPLYVRLVRGSTMAEKNKAYVEGSICMGGSSWHIIFHHVLPNIIPPVLVTATLSVATAIQIAAGLSFLGLGAQPPNPEWGSMLSTGRNYMRSGEWWMTVFPGLAIFLTVLAINLLGDGLRDALDPRLRNNE
jgi:peptide/nickel transport system permease protein